MQNLLMNKQRLRIVGVIFFLCAVILLMLLWLLSDDKWGATVSGICQNLLATILGSAFVAFLTVFLFREDIEKPAIQFIGANEINSSNDEAIKHTEFWYYQGDVGNYVRNVVFQSFARAVDHETTSRKLRLLILDPRQTDFLQEFINYRTLHRNEMARGDQALEDLVASILATILATYRLTSKPYIDAEVRVCRRYSLIRRDICSDFVLLTTGKADAPAISISSTNYQYSAHKHDFECQYEQAESIVFPSAKKSNVLSRLGEGFLPTEQDVKDLLTELDLFDPRWIGSQLLSMTARKLSDRRNPYPRRIVD
jgi:hypothetical protein